MSSVYAGSMAELARVCRNSSYGGCRKNKDNNEEEEDAQKIDNREKVDNKKCQEC